MTRDTVKMSYEEMIDTLKGLVFGTFDRTTVKEREALDMAIKALKQDSILDKVKQARKEMDDLASHKVRPISFDQAVAIDMCIKILDKLIKEVEE